MNNPEVGIITEQGDLGLGYDKLDDDDQKAYAESQQEENKETAI